MQITPLITLEIVTLIYAITLLLNRKRGKQRIFQIIFLIMLITIIIGIILNMM